MSALREQTWTVEQYLEFERTSEIKHEYLDGYIYAMSGASANHNLISGNTFASLHAQLRKRPCIVFPSDQRVKADRLYAYPDISVVCGSPEFTGDTPDTLANPTLIVEVLSPSTEKFDRGKKFHYYLALDSLQAFVLISQSEYRVERYRRQADGEWLYSDAVGVDATLELASIGCSLSLADVYEKVIFEDEETPSEDER
jgi:Uma2 family endonuclease